MGVKKIWERERTAVLSALLLVAVIAGVWSGHILTVPRAAAPMRDVLIQGNPVESDPWAAVRGRSIPSAPSISSSCITGSKSCIIAVPGGSLRLTSIHFPNQGEPGQAEAVGYVNGQFVSGIIQLSPQPVHGSDNASPPPDWAFSDKKGVKKGYWSLPQLNPPRGYALEVPPPGIYEAQGGTFGLNELKAGHTRLVKGDPTIHAHKSGFKSHKQLHLQTLKAKARKSRSRYGKAFKVIHGAHQLAEMSHQQQGADKFYRTEITPEQTAKHRFKQLATVDHDKAAEEQYKAALAAVEGHMKERMDKVEQEATKIAEAVTRVITSPEVSKKIADLAMDAAAAKAGPAAEASLTGGVQDGVNGVGQFGYANEPAGTVGESGGRGSAAMVATTPDLDTVPTVSSGAPASSYFYNAWKASGATAGTVQQQQYPATSPQQQSLPVGQWQPAPAMTTAWGAPTVATTGQPLMPYTLSAAMMGATGFVHGEPIPEDGVAVQPAVRTAQGGSELYSQSPSGPPLSSRSGGGTLHTGDASMMAQMQQILSSPGGAGAAAQYQQAAQLATDTQQAPAAAPAQTLAALGRAGSAGITAGDVGSAPLPDPWGVFSSFQNSVPVANA